MFIVIVKEVRFGKDFSSFNGMEDERENVLVCKEMLEELRKVLNGAIENERGNILVGCFVGLL